jgi:ribose transport system substrate-binding protein
MPKIKVLVSLTTNDNDYQVEQARAAEQAARKFGVDLEIRYADNDAINQSTQILKAIQAAPDERPDAIIFEPVGGTSLPQVARAAVNAEIGWAVLNREANYISELRRSNKAPIFSVSSDHVEAKPANIHLITLKGQWTEESSQRAVRSWLKLSTSQKASVDLVAAQDDSMAIGARKAFQEILSETERERWLSLPFLGCDGLPKTGQAWVRTGVLTATIYIPPNTGQAIEMVVEALQNNKSQPERALTEAVSIPPIETLRPSK